MLLYGERRKVGMPSAEWLPEFFSRILRKLWLLVDVSLSMQAGMEIWRSQIQTGYAGETLTRSETFEAEQP